MNLPAAGLHALFAATLLLTLAACTSLPVAPGQAGVAAGQPEPVPTMPTTTTATAATAAAAAAEPAKTATPGKLTPDQLKALSILVAARLGGSAEDYRLRELPDVPLIEAYSVKEARIAYIDRDVRHVFIGSLYDALAHTNLTQVREKELNRLPLASIPKDRTIRIVKGTGVPQFAVFEDPDCPFCRAMEAKLDELDNYTAFVLLLPLNELHPRAEAAARAIWCAEDPSAAWHTYMHGGRLPEMRECASPIAELKQLAQRHRVSGTPTLVMPDGEIVEGMPDLAAFKLRLSGESAAEAAGAASTAASVPPTR